MSLRARFNVYFFDTLLIFIWFGFFGFLFFGLFIMSLERYGIVESTGWITMVALVNGFVIISAWRFLENMGDPSPLATMMVSYVGMAGAFYGAIYAGFLGEPSIGLWVQSILPACFVCMGVPASRHVWEKVRPVPDENRGGYRRRA